MLPEKGRLKASKSQQKSQQKIQFCTALAGFENTRNEPAHCSLMGKPKLKVCLEVKEVMRKAYRMFRRNRSGVYQIENNSTGEQRSLKTKNREEAQRLLDAENQARKSPALNLELGKVYLRGSDPEMGTRTWQVAMDELSSHGKLASQSRCKREMDSKAFDLIRDKLIVDTTKDDLRMVLKRGGAATNNYLRRLYNLAFNRGWVLSPIIHAADWDKAPKKEQRGITLEEHNRILAAEKNVEKFNYYRMLWLIGAAQTDCSQLSDKNINWKERTLWYYRSKTGQLCTLAIGQSLETLLKCLPQTGFLFPKLAQQTADNRASEFYRRCKTIGIKGVSLHSYRYGWAERAAEAGYLERYAQAALGHSSKAVHRSYAKKARAICPPLETEGVIIPFPTETVLQEPEKTAARA